MDEEGQKDEDGEEEERYYNCKEMNVEGRNRGSEDKEEEGNTNGEEVNIEEIKKESEEKIEERKRGVSADTEERDKGDNTKGEEEEPKIGESRLGDTIMKNENRGEKENPVAVGWYKTPARKGRRPYRSQCRPNLLAAAKVIRRSGTHTSLEGDVIDKNNGQKEDRQDSTRRVTCTHKRRGGNALRISSSRTGTLARRHRPTQGRQTVKLKKEMCRTGLEFKTHPHNIPATVHHWISKMKVALIVMISTYVWNLGQANPLVGDKETFAE